MIRLPAFHIKLEAEGMIDIVASNGEALLTIDYHKALEFMVHRPLGYPLNIPRVVWKVSELVGILKTMLPKMAVEGLSAEPFRVAWDDMGRYRLYYNPGKVFQDNVNHEEVLIYSLSQFFPDGTEAPANIEELTARCRELTCALKGLGVTEIKQMYSPVAVMEDAGLLEGMYENLPTFVDIPDGCCDYAMEVGGMLDKKREWNECYQTGYFKEGEVWSYDVASCYGWHGSRLRDIRGADIKKSKTYVGDAVYGFLRGDLSIDPSGTYAYCSPIVYPVGDRLTNPVGIIKNAYLTLDQARFIEWSNIGTFKLKDGWFISNPARQKPLANIVRHFHKSREGASPLSSYLLKRAITGIIGRMGEWRRDKSGEYLPGQYFNPVYRSLILTGASLQVGQFLVNYEVKQEELVLVAVDGAWLTRRIPLPLLSGLGQWRCAGTMSLIIAGFNQRYKDKDCDTLLDEIETVPDAVVYPSLDLSMALADQDRLYARYPRTGKELISRRFVSYPVLVGE